MPWATSWLSNWLISAGGARPLGFRREAFDALDQQAAVPAPVEDRHAAAAGEMPPEAPQVMLRALLFGRRGDGNDLAGARVDRRGEPADGAALAGGVPSLEHQNRRDAAALRPADGAG